ncbi:MAG: putative lipid II flippase FtsW [Anaeromyxobacter sp.]|nr:putative lipid II flippase FtsW [Anaeromyxobacter sp.]MBL0275649.1 putative lipid II flippase FtsW [Anaeromyxobacter sp.]
MSDGPVQPRLQPLPFDWLLLTVVLALAAGGAVMVYSASAIQASRQHGDEFFFLKRQAVAFGLGFAGLVLALQVGYRRMAAWAYPLLVFSLLMLVLVLVPGIGKVAGGARRWINLGLINFQPAELAKVVLVLYLAHSLSRKREKVRLFSIGFLPHLLVTGLMVVLCLLERDMGTGVIMLLVLFTMLFAAGARLSYLVGAVLLALPIGWKLITGTPYRMERWLAYLDPWGHREGAGFQLVESLLGIGNGGWTGQGLGQGKGKLFYLPAAHTDFIAAVIAEEAGLLGIAVLLLLYGVLVWRGLRASLRAAEPFGAYLALGLTTLFGAQALVNLAVVFGLLPTKGLTLPLVSYGGSSLMTLLLAAGVLLSVSGDRGGFLTTGVQAVRVGPARGAAEAAS